MYRKHIRRLLSLLTAALIIISSASAAYTTLRAGDKGQDVLTMQTALIQLGYQISADGAFGKNTRAAVVAFQKDYNLKADGLAGDQTLTLLYSLTGLQEATPAPGTGSSSGSLKPGSTGSAVKDLQQKLQQLGYTLTADGQYGANTAAAVRQFQADYGLKVTGTADEDTQLLLSQMVMNMDTLARVETPQGGTLTLREERKTSSTALALIPNYTILSIRQRSSTWCKVYYGGHTGYVLTKYLNFNYSASATIQPAVTPTPTPTPAASTLKARVETPLGGTLTVREVRKTSSNALALIPNLTIVTVLERGSTWCKISFAGQVGYVLTKYLNFNYYNDPVPATPTPAVPSSSITAIVSTSNGGGLNMRLYADTNAKVLAVIPNRTQITVNERGSVWSAVTYNGQSGYVMTGYLDFSASLTVSTPTPAPSSAPAVQDYLTGRISTNGSSLNLRSGPAMGDNILTSLANGTYVTVLEYGETWSLVISGSYTGWVQSQYLQILGSSSTPTPAGSSPTATPAPSVGYDTSVYTRTLRSGYTGSDVASLQYRLADLRYPINVTAVYDAQTIAAVRQFQLLNGLSQDGIAGAKTFAAMYAANVVPYTGTVSTATPAVTATPTPVPTPSGSEGYDTALYTRTIRSGYTGQDVTALQNRLAALNYPVSVTGVYDEQTMNAVKLFQKLHNLTQDGITGPKTLSTMYSATVLSYTSEVGGYTTMHIYYETDTADAATVTRMQQALSNLGYRVNVNGRFDELTHNAVQQFQLRNGLTVSGAADAATQARIFSGTGLSANAAPAVSLSAGQGIETVPDKSEVSLLHWYNVVKPLLRTGNTLKVLNPVDGTVWYLRVMSCGRHCDAEPKTLEDTLLMNRSFNNTTSWVVHVVYVQLPDGRWTMATMHNRPHLSGSIANNGFDGHLCVHFLRDMSETQANDPNYGVQNQTALRSAWKALTGEAVE